MLVLFFVQAMEGMQKWKKAYLMMLESKMAQAMCLYWSMVGAGVNVSTVQRTETKKKSPETHSQLSCETPFTPFSKRDNYVSLQSFYFFKTSSSTHAYIIDSFDSFSCHPFLSDIAPGKSSRRHRVFT